jgi:transposase
MLQVEFSQEDIDALFKQRYLHPHPWVQERMEALYLKSQKMPHGEIRRLLKISSRTLVNWIRMYQQGGIEGLKRLQWKGARSALTEHRSTLEEYFKKHPPISVKDARTKIKELTGVERSEALVRRFLHSLNMRFRKTGNVPGKADLVKQEEFKKKSSSPCWKTLRRGRGKCSSWMQRISCGLGLLGFCGA